MEAIYFSTLILDRAMSIFIKINAGDKVTTSAIMPFKDNRSADIIFCFTIRFNLRKIKTVV